MIQRVPACNGAGRTQCVDVLMINLENSGRIFYYCVPNSFASCDGRSMSLCNYFFQLLNLDLSAYSAGKRVDETNLLRYFFRFKVFPQELIKLHLIWYDVIFRFYTRDHLFSQDWI